MKKRASGITLEEAIETLEEVCSIAGQGTYEDGPKALQLGIEALKAVKDARVNNYYTPIPLLPGETKD